jgi:hypothetical protein
VGAGHGIGVVVFAGRCRGQAHHVQRHPQVLGDAEDDGVGKDPAPVHDGPHLRLGLSDEVADGVLAVPAVVQRLVQGREVVGRECLDDRGVAQLLGSESGTGPLGLAVHRVSREQTDLLGLVDGDVPDGLRGLMCFTIVGSAR